VTSGDLLTLDISLVRLDLFSCMACYLYSFVGSFKRFST